MRILCVDDDSLVRAVTADLLRELGHDVVEATGSEGAALIMAGGGIELLITDIHMPEGINGQELARLARQSHPSLPVIYFSGFGHVVPDGVTDHVLRKPCNLGDLQQAIRHVAH